MNLRIPVVVMAVTAVLAIAATAQAATLSVVGSRSCYRLGDTLTVTGTGFTPSGPVSFALDDEDLGSLSADAAGNLSAPLTIGTLDNIGTRTLIATDESNPANVASAQFLGSPLSVTVRPRTGPPGRLLDVGAAGFTTGQHLYGHVRRKGYRRNVFIGVLKRPCHTLSVRRRILPASLPGGVYTVQFDTKRFYSSQTVVHVRFKVTVTEPKPKPRPRPRPEPPSPPPTNCQGYYPCIPPGPDVDCAGGSGNGPRYVEGPVRVTGEDPYGLDSDGDGLGCES